jgi:transposase
MPAAYSSDLRERVLADRDAGVSTAEAAKKYRVSPAWVRRLVQRRRETGETAPKAQRHGPVPLSVTHGEQIRQAVKEQPDATLAELRDRLGLDVALSTLWEALKALKLTFKKNAAGSRAGQARREGDA